MFRDILECISFSKQKQIKDILLDYRYEKKIPNQNV